MLRPPTRTRRRHPAARTRAGFTLIELLVVIVVLAILIALLLPVINGAIRTGQNAAVQSDINRLATALAQFKEKYGIYPPSRIILRENGNYDVANIQAAIGAPYNTPARLNELTGLVQRSVAALRKMWPQMALTTSGTGVPAINAPQAFYDFNGDGFNGIGNNDTRNTPIVLQGAECLVFFLGGLPSTTANSTTANAVAGFANQRLNPFMNAAVFPNRSNGMLEFAPGRITDVDNNGYPEYLDGLGSNPRPIVYFSAYNGQGYDPDDCNYYEYRTGDLEYFERAAPDPTDPPIEALSYATNIPGRVNPVTSRAPNPYTSGSAFASKSLTPPDYINKSSFQIISAGQDNLFGVGGLYNANGTSDLLLLETAANNYAAATKKKLPANIRIREQDNLTNFKNGRLQ